MGQESAEAVRFIIRIARISVAGVRTGVRKESSACPTTFYP
jgi:hypothetical protein